MTLALRDLVDQVGLGLYSQDEHERVYDCPSCERPLRFALDGTPPTSCDAGCTVEAITAAAAYRSPRGPTALPPKSLPRALEPNNSLEPTALRRKCDGSWEATTALGSYDGSREVDKTRVR